MTDLLPCPFCGGEPSWTGDYETKLGNVSCENTDCFGPRTTAARYADAAIQWNRRAVVTTLAQRPAMTDALREAERFMAYFSGETDGVFVGPGTPQACLAHIRHALAAQPPAAPVETPRTVHELDAILNSEDTRPCTVLPDGNVVYQAEDICECPKCGRNHRKLGNPPWVSRSSADNVQEITSIVSRLRNFAVWNARHSHYDPVPLCKEAADLIERLTAVPQGASDWRDIRLAAIEECRAAAFDAYGTIATGDYVLTGPAGIARAMLNAIDGLRMSSQLTRPQHSQGDSK